MIRESSQISFYLVDVLTYKNLNLKQFLLRIQFESNTKIVKRSLFLVDECLDIEHNRSLVKIISQALNNVS
jgi:hypothetical protein